MNGGWRVHSTLGARFGNGQTPLSPALSPTQAVGKGAEAPAIAGAHPAAESRLAIAVSGRL